MSIKPSAATALRNAMTRLLAGEPQRTDGKLTWTNVFTEARVPRATAARAHDLIEEWQTAIRQRTESGAPPVPGDEARVLKAELADKARVNAETVNGLRASIRTMANHIQALTLALEDRDRAIATLTAKIEQSGGNVVAIRATTKRERV